MEVQASGRIEALVADLLTLQTRFPALASDSDQALLEDVSAVLVAQRERLSSLDYARNKAREMHLQSEESPLHLYHETYLAAAAYMERMIARLDPSGLPDPSPGVFRAALALERLPASLLSAHLLYELGHRFEGHAVSRLMLEQIAWALSVSLLDDPSKIQQVRGHSEMKRLTSLVPPAGRLYGSLSKLAHIYSSFHREFFVESEDGHRVIHAEMRTQEYAEHLLMLADVFGIVWEVTQADYLPGLETVVRTDNEFRIVVDRPFFKECNDIIARFEAFRSD